MRIDHIAIYANDLEAMKSFFTRFFGAIPNDQYHNKTTGLRTYFLQFYDGSKIEIMNRPDMLNKEKAFTQTGYTHLGFSVGGKEMVDKLTSRLQENGYDVLSGPRTTGDGYYESCILGPEGNLIELTE
jgi:Lactoylglutathione lyase and related lyases